MLTGIGIGVPFTRRRGFSAGDLFANSEVGVWYDPSDFSTMYQDSAGTTAVTAVGQPVGLILDKSKGLVLGPELITNGDFSAGSTGWDLYAGASVVNSEVVFDGATAIASGGSMVSPTVAISVTAGKYYRVGYKITANTTEQISAKIGGTLGIIRSTAGVYSEIIKATTTEDFLIIARNTAGTRTGGVDNISVRELPGNHATQATSTARMVTIANGLDADGVDDAIIEQLGGGGTTGFFLCTAVRPDGGAGTARTIWSDAGTNTGYIIRLNASNQLEIAAGNGTAYTLAATTDTLSVGTTYVITAWDDGTNLSVQVNSGTAGTAARPVVSAGTATATIGKDNGAASGFFNGAPMVGAEVYVKNGQNVDAADRAAAQAYVASKAGVTL